MNNSELDILNNTQQIHNQVYYNDNEINGCSNIGFYRKNQEDSLLISRHPTNDQCILLAVADGMGGLNNGGIASYICIKELLLWFKNLDHSFINNEINVQQNISIFIEFVDNLIRKKCGNGGTTLSFSLILNNKTLFVNIGDSRIYYCSNDNLIQITDDHSRVYDMYKKGYIKNKDDIRFHKSNNLINSKLGGYKKNYRIDFKYLYNNEYEKILLFTDGVTDCLSEEIISNIINNCKNDKLLSKEIVDYSLINNSYKEFNNNDYYNSISGGKDNSTSCCYIKRR